MRGVMEGRTARVFYALAAVVAVAYFALVGHFADNIPFWDDYLAEQNFLVRFLQSPALSQKLHLLIEQHNEHRLLFTRLTTLIVYLFTGKLNYVMYITLANAMLIGTGILMFTTVKDDTKKAFGTFLIALLLCNGQHLETSVWAMSGLANIGTLFLAFMSLYYVLRRETSWVVVGFALSVLTVFSNGNGIVHPHSRTDRSRFAETSKDVRDLCYRSRVLSHVLFPQLCKPRTNGHRTDGHARPCTTNPHQPMYVRWSELLGAIISHSIDCRWCRLSIGLSMGNLERVVSH